MRIAIIIRNNARTLGEDERGVALYYTAIVAFLVLALFSLIYDVARVSETKMQMQNAADAAALEMAVWQARGMNIVQNLNDEIYSVDLAVQTGYVTAAGLTIIGHATKAFFGVGYVVEGAGAAIAYLSMVMRRGAVDGCLKPLRHFYAYSSCAMGYLSANQAAKLNGADPFVDLKLEQAGSWGQELQNLTDNFVAIGLPSPYNGKSVETAIRLPLVKKAGAGGVLKFSAIPNVKAIMEDPQAMAVVEGANAVKAAVILGVMFTNTFIWPKVNWVWTWHDDGYYECTEPFHYVEKESGKTEEGNHPLPPMIWVVHKKNEDLGLISNYFLKDPETGRSPLEFPVVALAAAQARGGNVVGRNSPEYKYRPRRYGVGADAVLVPVSKALPEDMRETVKGVILH